MQIKVQIKPRSKEEKVELTPEGIYKVSVKAAPVENKANFALIEVLSKHFKVPMSFFKFKSGLTSKTKIIEIKD